MTIGVIAEDDDEGLKCWKCPACKRDYELGEAAWRAFDPKSPAFCPDVECGAELDCNL